jgi:hypothetical protein
MKIGLGGSLGVGASAFLALTLLSANLDLRAHAQVPLQADAAGPDARAASDLAERFSAAWRARDANRLRSLLVENYRRLQKSDPERVKGELAELAQIGGGVDLAGPTLTYLLALQGQGELPKAALAELDKTLGILVEETLNPRSELACLRAQQRLLEELASGRPVSQELWLENLACDSEQNTPDPITLRDGLVLDAIDAPGSFVHLLDRPPGIAIAFTARIDPVPPQPVLFNSDGRQLVLQTLPLREVPADFRTQVYTITLTSGGRDHAYRVVLPVNLGTQVPVLPVLVPGTSFEILLQASGGSADCAALPPGVQLPCGAMTWQWVPDPGIGPLPAGMNLYTLPDGNARLSGTPQIGAISSRGRLRLEQAGQVTDRTRSLLVPVHLATGHLEALLGPHALLRGETFSLRLPTAMGGDGQSYTWSVVPAGPPLPPSVQLVRRGAEVWLEGMVEEAATLGRHPVQLRVESPLTAAASLFQTQLDVGHLLRVWTQNSFLRPPDVFPASFYTEAGLYLLSPLDAPFASSLLTFAAGIEAYWDITVQNTDDDNEERTDLILERAAEFDIVALQEAFSQQAEQVIDGAVAAGFFALPGPGPRDWRLPTNLSTGAVQASIPYQSSGLFLLLRKDLHTPPNVISGPTGQLALEVMRLAALNHRSQLFTDCNGFTSDGSDCLARKGFTLSTVHVGSAPDEFLFVVNTHLDAGSSMFDVTVRAGQLGEIATFVASATDGVHPILFMGDFNIAGEVGSPPIAGPELATLVGALGGVDLFRLAMPLMPGATVGYTMDSGVNAYAHEWGGHDPQNPTRERLDYLRVLQGSGFTLTPVSIVVMGDVLDSREEPRTQNCYDPDLLENGWVEANESLRCYFSDHWGVEAVLRLDRVSP